MDKADRETAARTLFEAGRSKKEIGRLLELDVKTVRRLLAREPSAAGACRSDKIALDEELVRRVFGECRGYAFRTWEVLRETHGLTLGYSTLTQKLRELGLGAPEPRRSQHVDDVPGEEMQHDTSPFKVPLGGKEQHLVLSGLYFRYSKMRYVKFYRRFDRHAMKCFLDEALRHFYFTARRCIIDNTSLARWYGTGGDMVPVPEMAAFARGYGFLWQAHAVGHSNRKAGKERNFWTVTTHFLPGRSFQDLEDLNRQAFQWATERYAQRPQSKTGLIPAQAFDYEKAHLLPLPPYLPPVYRVHRRFLDAYGFIAFGANYYWVPPKVKEKVIREVTVLEYAARIVLKDGQNDLGAFPLPPEGVRNERFTPEGVSLRHQPRNRKKNSDTEEKLLRARGEAVGTYLDFIVSKESGVCYKHEFIRRLFALSRKIASPLFEAALTRAHAYRVNRMETIAALASRILRQEGVAEQELFVSEDFKNRETYQIGRLSLEHALPRLEEGGTPNTPHEEKPC